MIPTPEGYIVHVNGWLKVAKPAQGQLGGPCRHARGSVTRGVPLLFTNTGFHDLPIALLYVCLRE